MTETNTPIKICTTQNVTSTRCDLKSLVSSDTSVALQAPLEINATSLGCC